MTHENNLPQGFFVSFQLKELMTVNYFSQKAFLKPRAERLLRFLELNRYVWKRWSVALFLETANYCMSFQNEEKIIFERKCPHSIIFWDVFVKKGNSSTQSKRNLLYISIFSNTKGKEKTADIFTENF